MQTVRPDLRCATANSGQPKTRRKKKADRDCQSSVRRALEAELAAGGVNELSGEEAVGVLHTRT
jgi:hypothetical protein